MTLPAFDMLVAGHPYPFTTELTPAGASLKVRYGRHDEASAVAEFDASLEVERLRVTDLAWVHHRRLEADGVLMHPADRCPDRTAAKAMRLWTAAAGSWATATIGPPGG